MAGNPWYDPVDDWSRWPSMAEFTEALRVLRERDRVAIQPVNSTEVLSAKSLSGIPVASVPDSSLRFSRSGASLVASNIGTIQVTYGAQYATARRDYDQALADDRIVVTVGGEVARVTDDQGVSYVWGSGAPVPRRRVVRGRWMR